MQSLEYIWDLEDQKITRIQKCGINKSNTLTWLTVTGVITFYTNALKVLVDIDTAQHFIFLNKLQIFSIDLNG